MDAGATTDTVTAATSCKACPRHAALGSLLGVAGWLGAALAAVVVAAVPFDFGESQCGVWGCLPPLPALAAMHLLWLVAGGATVWALRRWAPPALVRPAGVTLVVAAVVGLAVVVGQDLPSWLSHAGVENQHHWPKRAVYRIATLTDLPLVQAALTGVVCMFVGRRRPAACAVSPA